MTYWNKYCFQDSRNSGDMEFKDMHVSAVVIGDASNMTAALDGLEYDHLPCLLIHYS